MRDLGTVTISIDSKDVVITWAPWPLLPCSVLYVCSLFSLFPLFSQTLLTVLDLIHIATLKMSIFDGARGHESRGEVRLLGGMCVWRWEESDSSLCSAANLCFSPVALVCAIPSLLLWLWCGIGDKALSCKLFSTSHTVKAQLQLLKCVSFAMGSYFY